jgi:hypothetical protein
MKKYFLPQYEYLNPLTAELLAEIPVKTYTSGLEKQVGDIPVYAFLAIIHPETEEYEESLTLDMIHLCEREFDSYDNTHIIFDGGFNPHLKIPILVKKEEIEKYNKLRNDYLKSLGND